MRLTPIFLIPEIMHSHCGSFWGFCGFLWWITMNWKVSSGCIDAANKLQCVSSLPHKGYACSFIHPAIRARLSVWKCEGLDPAQVEASSRRHRSHLCCDCFLICLLLFVFNLLLDCLLDFFFSLEFTDVRRCHGDFVTKVRTFKV